VLCARKTLCLALVLAVTALPMRSLQAEPVQPSAEPRSHLILQLQQLGVAPEETLFIDDKIENVEGARAVGMQAELFTTWEEFVREVPRRYGLPEPGPA